MNDFEILEVAAQEIANDPKPYKDIRDAFRVFARKVRRMKKEQVAEYEKLRKRRMADLQATGGKFTSLTDLDDEIPF